MTFLCWPPRCTSCAITALRLRIEVTWLTAASILFGNFASWLLPVVRRSNIKCTKGTLKAKVITKRWLTHRQEKRFWRAQRSANCLSWELSIWRLSWRNGTWTPQAWRACYRSVWKRYFQWLLVHQQGSASYYCRAIESRVILAKIHYEATNIINTMLHYLTRPLQLSGLLTLTFFCATRSRCSSLVIWCFHQLLDCSLFCEALISGFASIFFIRQSRKRVEILKRLLLLRRQP